MKIKTLALILGGSLVLAACGGSDDNGESSSSSSSSSSSQSSSSSSSDGSVVETRDNPTIEAEGIVYNDIAVHDPSVVRDKDGTFYVVGSHLAMASSTDLVTWTQEAPGIGADPDLTDYPLFSNYRTEVAEGIEWTGGYVGSWASDIRILEDGNYYFYFNHCTNPASGACDAPRSYLGVATSGDSIFGPYTSQGIFLWSGQTDAEMQGDYGVGDLESFDATIHPNVIDPHTFYDKDGNLWMTYGSYSGGIHILAMDESTGKPEPGQGYGKHIMGGDHSAIEGSFVLYSPESDYYYMFVSFGGFVSTDGYNIRIARSRNPDGPYLDAEGNDMANARGGWDSIAPYGVKMMGGFNFQSRAGDVNPSRGYLAPGHNSAYYDEETGKHYLITHTRFPDRGEAHAIRVHEMFVNEDEWLVASPHRYAPIDGENVVDSEDVVGDYQFINHGKDINRQAKQSQAITLHEDGTITGEVTGTYRLYSEALNRITLTLDELGSFEGELRWQWDNRTQSLVPVFTALSGQGDSIWGSQLPAMSVSEVLTAVADGLEVPESYKGDSLTLPTDGMRGAQIVWESSNELVIDADSGSVERPAPGAGNATVMLTATVMYGGEQQTRDFSVEVPERMPYNRVAQFEFEGNLGDSVGQFDAAQPTGDRIWKVDGASIGYEAGNDGQALRLDGSNGVRLPDGLIDNYEYTISVWARPAAITQFTTLFFGALPADESDETVAPTQWISLLPSSWDENTMLWSGSQTWFDGSAGEQIPTGEWSHLAVTVDQGWVRLFINGEQKFAGGNLTDFFSSTAGRFAVGVNYWDLPFNGLVDELNIYDAALSAGEIQALDIDQLSASELLNVALDELSLGDTSAVVEDLELPLSGPFASAVSWSSSDSSVVEVSGDTALVTRPSASAGDATVTLTATVMLDGNSATKSFTLTVLAEGLPDPMAHYSFDDHLDDVMGNVASGAVTGNRLDNTGGSIAYGAGQVGRALSLDGTSGVKLANGLLTDATYSVSLWLNPTELTQFTTTFFGAASSTSWVSVVPYGHDVVDGNTLFWSGEAWFDGDAGTQIPTGSWSHFVAVNNAGSLTVYLNGEVAFTGDNFPDVFSSVEAAAFGVGVNHWDTPYNGLVDELRIYDVPLTGEDVTALYQNAQ